MLKLISFLFFTPQVRRLIASNRLSSFQAGQTVIVDPRVTF
jgi:hypothetical protein